MNVFSKNYLTLQAVLGVLITLAALDPAQAQNVGTAAAANTVSTGTPPGGKNRVIELGAQIVRREKIDTSNSGSVQLLFIDKTTFNIGPSSSVVIDDFVFNPDSDTGRMTATLTKGVLRVVGGQASHTGGTTIRTPSATIGIRGGVATVSYCAAASCAVQGTRVINHFGTLSITSAGGTETIRRPGFAVTIAPPASGGGGGSQPAPTAPTRVQQAEVDGSNQALSSKSGQVGGAKNIPSDQIAVTAGVGNVNVNVAPTYRSVQSQTASDTQTRVADVSTSTTSPSNSTTIVSQSQTQRVDTVAPTQLPLVITPPVVPPVPPVVPPTPLPAPTAFALMTTASGAQGDASKAPYLAGIFAASGSYQVSQVLGYRAGGANTDGTPNTTSRVIQGSLNITGSGQAQNATLSVMTALINNDSQFGYVQAGGFVAVSQSNTNANVGVSRAQGAVANPGAIAIDSDNLPTGSYTVNATTINTDNAANLHTRTATPAFTNAGAGSNFTFSETQTRVATPAGLGVSHPDDDLTGYATGVGRTRTFTPPNAANATSTTQPYIINNANNDSGDVTITLRENSSRISAQFNLKTTAANTANNPVSAQINFGSGASNPNGGLNSSRGAYIDSQNFAARAEVQFNGGDNVETSSINGVRLNTDLGGTNSRSNAILVSSDVVKVASFFPNVTFCQCDYTRWGLWSIDTFRTDASGSTGYSDRSGISTFVAGRAAAAADVPTTGIATYTGHVIASISQTNGSGSNSYLAASNFTNTINFGTRTGTVAINNLDGSAYNGAIAINSSNATKFATQTPIASTLITGRSLTLDGSFFKGATNPIGEMGGQVRLNGTNYIGAGTFAAKR